MTECLDDLDDEANTTAKRESRNERAIARKRQLPVFWAIFKKKSTSVGL